MVRLHASRAFCFVLLGTGAHVFAGFADGAAVAKPSNLRRLLSDAFSLTSLSDSPEREACSADKDCSKCLEIDASTYCEKRDVGVISKHTCDDVKEVVCCVFENDEDCANNDIFTAAIASLEDVCPMELPCLGGNPLDEDFEKLLTSNKDKVEGDAGAFNAADGTERDTDEEALKITPASGATLSFGSSFLSLEFVVALSSLLLVTGRIV